MEKAMQNSTLFELMKWLFMAVAIISFFTPLTDIHQQEPAIEGTELNEEMTYNQSIEPLNAVMEDVPPQVRGFQKEIIFQTAIEEAAERYQLDPALIKAIIMAESGFNPNAVSKRGAQGLMQLMPRTARSLGVEDSFNPEANIHAGSEYLKRLLNRFDGNLELALAAYNAGSRNVKEYKGVPPFAATQFYIKKVLGFYDRYKSGVEEKQEAKT